MKHFGNWIMAATLFCGLFVLTSCEELDERDNPVDNEDNDEVVQYREEILSHVKSDAKVLVDNIDPGMINLTNNVYSQLMTLMGKDRNYMRNMKQVLALMASNSALRNIKPVTEGSELAKMGYLMYIPVDIQTFGAQVVFDENGASRLFPCDGLEFIFPATVEGLGTTLYKVAFKTGSNWYESVAPAQLKGVKGLACVYRVPGTLRMTLSGLFGNQVVTLSEALINLDFANDQSSGYASLDVDRMSVSGQVSTSLEGAGYGLPDIESTLRFKYGAQQDGRVRLEFGYTSNGLDVMTMAAMLNGVHADVDVQILDDLRLYGNISDTEQFSQAFTNVIQNNQKSLVSMQEFSDNIDRLNLCTQLYLTCKHGTNPLLMKLMSGWENNANQLLPAVWSYEEFEAIPFSKLINQNEMDNINKAINLLVPSVSSNMVSSMQLFSQIIKMLPLNSAEWGI